MLGLMKMNISECIQSYTDFMKVVFPTKGFFGRAVQTGWSVYSGAKWSDAPLVKVIKDLIALKLGDPGTLLLSTESMKSPCKV